MEENLNPVDSDILRAATNKELYDKYKDIFKTYLLTPPGWGLLGDIGAYYDAYPSPNDIDPSTFRMWFRITRYPLWKTEKHSMYSEIFDTIFNGAPLSDELLKGAIKQRTMHAMKEAINKNDTVELGKLTTDLQELERVQTTTNKLVTESVDEVISSAIRAGGLSWRLEDLNQSAGNITKGDLVVIGKRPETGGTSFLLSEMTHMVSQLPEGKHALIINNEEYKTKIITRLVSCALGISAPTLYADPAKGSMDYLTFLGSKRIDVMSDGTIYINEIEKLLATGEYGLIGINVLEKLGGVSRTLEDFQRLERLGQWARKMSLMYGPVIAIVQADAGAEGHKYPDQSMLYKTKTGLQAEADLLIMIGRSPSDPEDTRGIHVAKNKLPGSLTTKAIYRHLKSEVNFDIETGRFMSKTWK